MYRLQDVYSLILNHIYRITSGIDERIKNSIITSCFLFIAAYYIAYFDKSKPFGLYLKHTRCNLICGAVLVIITLCSIKKPLEKTKWDRFLFYVFFFAGAGIVAISFLHSVGSGYRSFGLMMMFGFPCMYYVWTNRGDYDVLYKRLAASTAIVGIGFAAYCAKLALNGELNFVGGRATAFLINANMFSMVGMAATCSAIYMLAVNRHSIVWFAVTVLAYATGWEIVLLGGSRISMAVCALGTIALVIFSLKTNKTIVPADGHLASFIRWLIIAVVTFAVIYAGSVLVDINNVKIYLRESGAQTEEALATTEEAPQIAVPDGVTANNALTTVERFDTEGKDINIYTSGRINIWKAYVARLNMWGNSFKIKRVQKMLGSKVSHAHNNFLEYAYRCGVPVACIHILLELYAGIISIIFLFGKKYKEPYHLFVAVFMICYAFESMFDIATIPFERHAPFFFYMALIPVFGRSNENGVEQ